MPVTRTLKETKISVIIPTLNEEQNLTALVQRLHGTLSESFLSYELIFIDDHSSDSSLGVLTTLSQKYDAIQFFEKRGEKGKAFSLLEGFLHARYELVAMLDADLQYPPEALPEMAQKILEGYGVVVGKRVQRKVGLARKIASKGFSFFFGRILHGLNADVQSGIKVFKRELLVHLPQRPTGWTFDLEFLLTARNIGFSLGSVDVVFEDRGAGNSKIESIWKTSAEIGYNALKLKFSHPRTTAFSPELILEKGHGFFHKGKAFVPHTSLPQENTAFETVTLAQKLWVLVGVLVLVLSFLLNWHATLLVLFAILTVVYFFDLLFNIFLVFRSFAYSAEVAISPMQIAKKPDNFWPSYTVLCPLYKEWQVVPQFVKAMSELDYPKDRLQIMMLLEEDDTETIQKIKQQNLPANFEIVVVPHSKPKTKPKAMNYGLQFARGEYLVVYDAEDVPEALQLKKAVLAFTRSAKNVVCIQAKLNFYNPGQNILTKVFTAEYSLWFDLILTGLQSVGAPIPLGGTSNHFKTEKLKELRGWDAFNVTEDCDLGMRLAKQGYRTVIIDSTTLEEANSGFGNWYRQRSRWIKGYMQTYLVHMRDPEGYVSSGRTRDLLMFQLTVGGKILSMFINPFMWLITICYFLFRAHIGLFIESFFPNPILYIGVFSLIAGNFLYLYNYMIGCAKRGQYSLIKYVFLVPFYWLYMSVAAWQAFYEMLAKPHYWAKTVHGLHLAKEPEERLTINDLRLTSSKPPVISTGSQFATTINQVAQTLPAAAMVTAVQSEDVPREPRITITSRIKNLLSGNMAAGGMFVAASLIANFLNFLFNVILGRSLTLEDFATVTLFNTVLGVSTVALAALGGAVTYKIAFLSGEGRIGGSEKFIAVVKKSVWWISGVLSVAWALCIPFFSHFFNVSNELLVLCFTPVIMFGSIAAVQAGFLRGRFRFAVAGEAVIYEALSKVVIAVLFVLAGRHAWASLSIPASILISFATTWLFAHNVQKRDAKEFGSPQEIVQEPFPAWYFFASMVSGLAGTIFLNVDVLLAKHYMDPNTAGAYSLLSLVGKMVFLMGSLLTPFVASVVSRHEGARTNPRKDFYRLLGGTAFISFASFGGIALLGGYLVPLLFGERSAAIVPYLAPYCLAMALFAVSSTVIGYHIIKKQYSFSALMLLVSLCLVVGIIISPKTIAGFSNAMMLTGIVSFAVIFSWHFIRDNLDSIFRNAADFSGLFGDLGPDPETWEGKRILVFNWRDTKHAFAGGAELYIHELAKRWVEAGNTVTLFCGNDQKSSRAEVIEGVQIIRRGGFYTVYFWAFVYYILRFRNNFDVIVDCQNGIPFFTPLYAKQRVVAVLHHIHQDVFYKYLPRPLAFIAATLENRVMPFVYRNTKFITVSNSSKEAMEKWGIGLAGTQVVYPGVNLDFLEPGEKHVNPLVLYVGRLKAYKSVDTLIHAFHSVAEKIGKARLIIAGDGEESGALKKLVENLGLSNLIHFAGKVTEEQKLELLQQAWVFCNPSMMEGWGITSIEANACGVPVVASNVPGLCESVQNPHTGYLVEHGNSEAFAEKIHAIISNKELQKFMESESLAWAKNFTWEKSAQKSLEVLYE